MDIINLWRSFQHENRKRFLFISNIREIERDLYRNGNSQFPKFTNKEGNIRPQDSKLTTDQRTGIVYVLPSHAGVSRQRNLMAEKTVGKSKRIHLFPLVFLSPWIK